MGGHPDGLEPTEELESREGDIGATVAISQNDSPTAVVLEEVTDSEINDLELSNSDHFTPEVLPDFSESEDFMLAPNGVDVVEDKTTSTNLQAIIEPMSAELPADSSDLSTTSSNFTVVDDIPAETLGAGAQGVTLEGKEDAICQTNDAQTSADQSDHAIIDNATKESVTRGGSEQ